MKIKKIVWLIGILLVVLGGVCAGPVTNMVQQPVMGTNKVLNLVVDVEGIYLSTNHIPESLKERFQFYFEDRSTTLSERKLHPFNTMAKLLSTRDLVELEAAQASIGKELVQKSVFDSTREVFKDIPFIYRAAHQDLFLARLFRDSIGNTTEEDIRGSKTVYVKDEVFSWQKISLESEWANTNRLSYWKRITGHIEPRYGIRLDYAYAAFTVTRHKETIIFGDIRYHYGDLISGDIMASDIEALISIPLSDKTFLSGGIIQSIDPPDWGRRWSVKILHKIDGGRFFAGLTVKERPKEDRGRLVIGFERPW